MKKILYISLLLTVLCFYITGCGSTKSYGSESLNEVAGLSMNIKEGTLTSTGATIIIIDVNSEKKMFGADYRIDKKVKGIWKELKTLIPNEWWNAIGYSVKEDNKLELNINWKDLYGELKSGEYRLVKNVDDTYFSVEFTIE